MNISTPTKKGSVSQTAKPKSAKKGDDSSETCFDIVLYKEGLPHIGNIVLESTPLPFAKTCSSRHSTATKSRPSTPKPSMDASPSSRTCGNKRKTSPLALFTAVEWGVCYL